MIMKEVQTGLTVTIPLSLIAYIPNLVGIHDTNDSQSRVGLL